jgi:hypothetical protein
MQMNETNRIYVDGKGHVTMQPKVTEKADIRAQDGSMDRTEYNANMTR